MNRCVGPSGLSTISTLPVGARRGAPRGPCAGRRISMKMRSAAFGPRRICRFPPVVDARQRRTGTPTIAPRHSHPYPFGVNVDQFSRTGQKLAGSSGILELMDDLGKALTSSPNMRMMGGGNPASIPEVNAVWRRRMGEILADGEAFDRMLVNYDPPSGSPAFREALAACLNREFGWSLTPANIAITSGGQSAFFYLFNLLAGDGKKILLPLVPEYIGYANQGMSDDLFSACRPRVEVFDDRTFKYRVDFEAVEARLTDDIAAICASRPTNPSGNVLTDAEVAHLAELCASRGKLLILDNAYGTPFPGILFTDINPLWNENVVLTLSLSKLGLPGTRTGIVIAREEVASAMAAMTSVIGLSNGNVGQALVRPLLQSGELLALSRDTIGPFYRQKSEQATAWALEFFPPDLPVRIHRSEGALFLWFWFKGMPITARTLYERLKARDVLIVPGEFFFFGLDEPWQQAEECIRVTFSQPDNVVREGLEIIAEEVARAYSGG